mgnify:CR=1 FL=1
MKIADLAEGSRTIEDLAVEHHEWVREVVRRESHLQGEIVIYSRTSAEEHVRRLNLLATQLKDEDLEEAIACMRRACALNKAIGGGLPDRRSLRLPMFLQRAGRMGEAMQAFNQALRDVDDWVAAGPARQTSTERAAATASIKAVVYDQMRIAWKREGDMGKMQSAKRLADWHEAEGMRLHAILDKERHEAFLTRKLKHQPNQEGTS